MDSSDGARRPPVIGLLICAPGGPTREVSFEALGFPSPRTRLVVGKSQTCDLCVDGDIFISSQHFALRAIDGQVVLEDLSSTNGTTVNGIRVDAPVTLRADDNIRFGSSFAQVLHTPARVPRRRVSVPAPSTSPHSPLPEVGGVLVRRAHAIEPCRLPRRRGFSWRRPLQWLRS